MLYTIFSVGIKRSTGVILSPSASLRVNSAKDLLVATIYKHEQMLRFAQHDRVTELPQTAYTSIRKMV